MKIARRLLALTLGKRLPISHGTRHLRGVRAAVSIRRDSYGVPYIRADHEADVWFALGFCHAQDRGGQLELLVRAVRGTLSEIVGIDALPIDALSRRIGFRRTGERQLEVGDSDIQEQLDAYARGINAGFEHGLDKPPHEHALLGCDPTRWQAADVQGYCALLQLDTRSLAWRQLRDTIVTTEVGADPRAQRGLALLRDWDGRLDSDSSAASVYALMVADLCQRLVRKKAPRSAAYALGRGASAMLPFSTLATRRTSHLVKLLREQPAGYFDSWPDQIRNAIARAVRQLETQRGPDVANWRWGDVRPLTLVHAFAEKRPFDRIFNIGPLPGAGDCTTISQGGVDFLDPTSNQQWLPMLRVTIAVGDWDNCRYAISGGQSGNPLSPHYEDQIEPWRSGRGITIAWSEARIAAGTKQTLTLEPSPKRP